jgi:hypothetical protein
MAVPFGWPAVCLRETWRNQNESVRAFSIAKVRILHGPTPPRKYSGSQAAIHSATVGCRGRRYFLLSKLPTSAPFTLPWVGIG